MEGLTPDTADIIGAKYRVQKEYFATGLTRDADFRHRQLVKLRDAVLRHEVDIAEALRADLHKSTEESYLTETGLVLTELRHHIRGVRKWAKPRRVGSPLYMFPSRGSIMYEPLGNVLIIAPWNYPFQLLMMPLIGAISAGCCAILKPSPDAPATAALVGRIIAEIFPQEYVTVVQGGKDENTILLSHRFDIIFFTGSTRVGRVVMEAAAKHFTPVVLELVADSPFTVP